MRNILFLICVLGMSCTLRAQTNLVSWQNLNTLQAGEKIRVLASSSRKVSGAFLSVSDAAISVQQEAGSQAIQRQDVLSVKRMANKHRLRNALIGAGVGAGVGAVIGGAWNNDFVSRGVVAAVMAGVCLAPGAVVGALVPDHATIYKVGSH
jgi:tetrahydromethanopterin S-methyltransferase subunit E